MDRRTFSKLAGMATIGMQAPGLRLSAQVAEERGLPGSEAIPDHTFKALTSRVGFYRDVVNVGVLRSSGKCLLIDSGEASILDAAHKLGLGTIDWVLYTHYHRDQCSGASLMKKHGVKIAVPASEARFFNDATNFWLNSDRWLYHRFDFRPEAFVLRESVSTDRALNPGETFEWEGFQIQTVPTPGHTDGSLTYIVEIDGEKIAFTGDLIYGPGQVWQFYSYQKKFAGIPRDYQSLGGGMFEVETSLDLVLSSKPTMFVPSHGLVMKDPKQAVDLLWENLEPAMKNYFSLVAWRVHEREGVDGYKRIDVQPPYNVPMPPPLPATLPKWVHRAITTSWYIQAEDKSIFVFDCGHVNALAEYDRMVKSGEVSAIDGVWISHYHDDHVISINDLRRQYGTKVYAQKELVDILERPTAYSLPCIYPESIHVNHALSDGEVFHWKGYKMTGFYYPGQTIYHDGLLVEHDGENVFMNGDAFINWGLEDDCIYNRCFLGKDGANYGFEKCARLLLKLKPQVLLAAHYGAVPFSPEYLEAAIETLQERSKLFNKVFPWDDCNFGIDPTWIRAYPYRQTILKGQEVVIEVRAFNHSDSPRRLWATLRVPEGWQPGKSGSTIIPAHSEGTVRLTAVASKNPANSLEVLGVAVQFDDRRLGEFTEAIVDYLDPMQIGCSSLEA